MGDAQQKIGWAITACLLILTSGPFAVAETPAEPLSAPDRATMFTLPDLGGRRHSLEDYRGTVVLINFWATWCPPCLAEMPSLQRLKNRFMGRPFVVLGINAGEAKATVWRAQREMKVGYPLLLDADGEVARDWEVAVYPSSFLLDAEGRVVEVFVGALEWDSAAVIRRVEAVLPPGR